MAVRMIDSETGQEYSLYSVSCKVEPLYSEGERLLYYVVIGKGLFDYSEVRSVYINSFYDSDAAMDLLEELQASIVASMGKPDHEEKM